MSKHAGGIAGNLVVPLESRRVGTILTQLYLLHVLEIRLCDSSFLFCLFLLLLFVCLFVVVLFLPYLVLFLSVALWA